MLAGLILQAVPVALAQNGSSPAAEKNAAINAAIRKEAMENSQIKKTLHYLTDVYGPRLTGSPKLKRAGEWAAGQMKAWGFDRAELEPWEWGNPGWENDRASGFLAKARTLLPVFEPPKHCWIWRRKCQSSMRNKLESHYQEVQDYEFTIEKGTL